MLLLQINQQLSHLCTHAGCRAEASVDCNSIEIRVTWRVVRKVVYSLGRLRDNVRSLTQHQPRDVQAYAEHQHTQHSQITAHTKATEREREQGDRVKQLSASQIQITFISG